MTKSHLGGTGELFQCVHRAKNCSSGQHANRGQHCSKKETKYLLSKLKKRVLSFIEATVLVVVVVVALLKRQCSLFCCCCIRLAKTTQNHLQPPTKLPQTIQKYPIRPVCVMLRDYHVDNHAWNFLSLILFIWQ